MSDTDAGWVPDTAAAPRTTERHERRPFEADTSRVDGTETPGEVVYVRRSKLEALLAAVRYVAEDETNADEEDPGWDLVNNLQAALTAALAEFDAPHIPEVELVDWKQDHPSADRSKTYVTARQVALHRTPTAGHEVMGWMAEMTVTVVSRVEPPGLLPVSGRPNPDWRTHEEMLALATRFEEWWIYDLRDYDGPVLGWPDDDRSEMPPSLRWFADDPVEGPAVVLAMVEDLRSKGAREPSVWIAEVIDRDRGDRREGERGVPW